jgi:hypothetical protein
VNRHHIDALPQSQSGKEAGNTEHMVEMAVGQQEPVEPPEAGSTAQQLALRALPAIDQDALVSSLEKVPSAIAPRSELAMAWSAQQKMKERGPVAASRNIPSA